MTKITLKETLELAITILHLDKCTEAEDVLYAHYRELFPDSVWTPEDHDAPQ